MADNDHSEALQMFLRDSELNNSYTYDALKKTLNETWVSSYSYLHNKQAAEVNYRLLTYVSNNETCKDEKCAGTLYLDYSIRANFEVDYDLIDVYDRKEYRTSKFYKAPITPKDIAYNSTIFKKIPIVLIDNKVIWDYEIFITKDNTKFRLPFTRDFVLENERDEKGDIIYKTHVIQILVVGNSFYQRISTNRTGLNFNATNKTISLPLSGILSKNTEIMTKEIQEELIVDMKLSGSYSDQTPEIKEKIDSIVSKKIFMNDLTHDEGTLIASLHVPDEYKEKYELGSTIIPFDFKDGIYTAPITDDICNMLSTTTRNIYVSLIHVPELYKHTFYTGKDVTTVQGSDPKYFVLEEAEKTPYAMPIPVTSLLMLQTDIQGIYNVVDPTNEVKLHYPNIYEITKTGQTKIFYFYRRNDDIHYTVLFDFYFIYLRYVAKSNSLEKIVNDIRQNKLSFLDGMTSEQKSTFIEIFNKILKYEYFEYMFGEYDFIHNFLGLPCSDEYIKNPAIYEEPMLYRDTRMREWVKTDPRILHCYVLNQHKLGDSFYLYTNTIDLESRRRRDTSLEMIGEIPQTFTEDRYVFAFNNEKMYPILLNARVFVDGILIGDIYQDRYYFLDYFYIPCDLVTDDSFIEIEIYPSYSFVDKLRFDTLEDKKEFVMAEPKEVIFPLVTDLYYTADIPDDPYPHRYATDLFKVTKQTVRGDFEIKTYEEKKPVRYPQISKFTIEPADQLVLGQDMLVYCNKKPHMLRFAMERDGYPYIGFVEMDFNFRKQYLRIFRNGRLLPRNHYLFVYTYDNPRLIFLEEFKVGDIIYIDVTPYQYNEVFYTREIGSDELLVDLTGKINKPFDIRYFDVYMNGRKLSSNNVFTITPTQIRLVNLKSSYNLIIYEKERDYEFYGLDYTLQDLFYFTLDDLLDSGLLTDEEKKKVVDDLVDKQKDPHLNIKPNTNDEEPQDWSDPDYWRAECYIYYYDELLPKTNMNPDELQTSSYIMEDVFADILRIYSREPIGEHDDILCLDPDIPTPDPEFVPENGFQVLPVGHLGEDLDKEILEQEIKINNTGNLN